MSDSTTRRDSAAAANRATAGPSRKDVGGQPLRTKAEKRAEAKAAKARARVMRKRRQAFAVSGSAVAVLALVVGLVAWVGRSTSQPNAADASASAPASPGATETTEATVPFPPVPAGADPALSKKPTATAGTGTVTTLKTTTLIQGTGAPVRSGQTINVNYVGVTYADGREFDSSWSRSQAFSFPIGAGKVIRGWDQGLLGVKVGSRVQLDIPADMAYGDNPSGGRPAGALRFVVDVLSAA